MSNDLPPVVLLRAFDAAGRHLSFTRAASALHVTPSTISHQIADLEAWLGVQLFVRSPRGLGLTAEGADLLDDVAGAFERLRAASARLRLRGQPVTVRVSANPFFASEVLIPLIPGFDAAFPGHVLHVHATEALEDPRDRSVDFCVRFGAVDEPGLERATLYEVAVAPVRGAGSTTEGAPRIDFPFRGASAWRQWAERSGSVLDPGPGVRQFNTFQAAMRAVAQDLGVGLGLLPVIQRWIDGGLLRRVEGLPAVGLGPIDLVHRPLAPSEATLRAVRDWLVAAFRGAAGLVQAAPPPGG